MPSLPRKHLTAWLGLIAMWLIVLAPVVSQLVVSARLDDPATAVLCSATHPAADTEGGYHAHGDLLAACGYCNLLATQVAIPTVLASLLLAVLLIAIAAVPVLSTRFTPLGVFPSGRPRGPPAFP